MDTVASHSLWALLVLGLAVGAYVIGMWRKGTGVEGEAIEDETMPSDIYTQEVLPLQIKAHPDLISDLQRVARELAADGAEITADDIHERVAIPKGVDRRVMAAAFTPKGDWRLVRYQKSRRPENHFRTIAVWKLRETVAV